MPENKKKVLIVEDDPAISIMYKSKLETEGFELIIAEDGAAGLELAKKEKPDIIMLDVILPQLDGFSVLGEIKKDENIKDIPVLMLTNLGTEEDRIKGKAMGAADYLLKADLTPTDVAKRIKEKLAIN